MQVVIGASPAVVEGVRAAAGAVSPRAAVEPTAMSATASCLTACLVRILRPVLGKRAISVRVITTTLRYQCPPASNVGSTDSQ